MTCEEEQAYRKPSEAKFSVVVDNGSGFSRDTLRVEYEGHVPDEMVGALVRVLDSFVPGTQEPDEDGWEHASVSPAGDKREDAQPCPSWAQMHEVKRILWDDSETVVQLHPAEGEYFHGPGFDTNILHLWRPCDGDWSRIEEEGMEHGK